MKWLLPSSFLMMALLYSSPVYALTLEECRTAALDHNPDIQSALQRVQAAAAGITEARSTYLPSLKAGANYLVTDNPPQAFFARLNQRTASLDEDFNTPDDTENLRLSLIADILLLDGGQRSMRTEQARLEEDLRTDGLEAIRNELLFQVTRAYFGALQARENILIQEETLRSVHTNLYVARERVAAGSRLKTDVLQLEVQLSEAQEGLIRARHAHDLAVATLNALIGEELASRDNLATHTAPAEPDPTAQEPSPTYHERPELRMAKKRVSMMELEAKSTRRDRLPSVYAFASSDWDSDISSDFEQSYLAGVSAEVDLFSGFRQRASEARAFRDTEEVRQQLRETENRLHLDIIRADLAVQEAEQRRVVLSRSSESAEEALRIVRERYENGAADITELLSAQTALTAAKSRSVMARYDLLTSQANVERATGALGRRYSPVGESPDPDRPKEQP